MGQGGGTAAEELLERLVEQFASPYDFLRELVQNAMDAGSDRVDVELHVHRDGDDDDVVFEIAVADAGSGMDQQCIDAELTRLFASSKRLDRTMAGGFGVGFVSIFAWAPACVLVQTGCRGEAWEIEFDAQRRFTRRRLVDPIEGTTVRSFRAGRASEADAIAEQVRASLWRWCRFCRVDIGFTYAGKHERIHEELPADDDVLVRSHRAADTYVRVAFGEPALVVLRRHGLVLAEGTPAVHLPAELIASWPHLQVWADSPALSTDIGRDHVLRDAGRKLIDARVVDLVGQLRKELVDAIEALVRAPSWSVAQHERYGQLHAHLAWERDELGSIERRALIRMADGTAVSLRELDERAQWAVVARVEPGGDAAVTELGVPVLVATADDARTWLDAWLATRGLATAGVHELVRAIEPSTQPDPFVAAVSELARRSGFATIVHAGAIGGGWGIEVPGGALVSPARLREQQRVALWIDERHPLFVTRDAAALVLALAAELGADIERVVAAIDEVNA